MATRQEKRLNPKTVAGLKKPGRYPDGGGLYLDVTNNERRRWVWIYRLGPRRREMVFASFADMTLAEARAERDKWRALAREGRDPIDTRKAERARAAVKTTPTFGQVADNYIEAHRSSWKNEKHATNWANGINSHAARLRARPVDQVGTEDVLAVLKPIWGEIPDTASRLRGRIELMLDAARALGHIEEGRANPARWKGHLDKLLAKRARHSKGHFAAMPWAEVPAFVAELRDDDSVSARVLEFAILTAARSGEARGVTMNEIDEAKGVWTLPAARMKAGREHRVPLSPRALAIVHELRKAFPKAPFIFPGGRPKRPLSDMALSMYLRGRKIPYTTHGFRSSFRNWVGEATNFARELAEAALAHAVGDATEAAYWRGDALERRRELMEGWARFLEGEQGANVIPLRRPDLWPH